MGKIKLKILMIYNKLIENDLIAILKRNPRFIKMNLSCKNR